jgi:prepilin signal peptidase PulO-like enzyme (type II secretory pathway)
MIPFIAFCIGLLLGSFGNVVSLRLHTGEKGIVNGRSKCPKCKNEIKWYDNIPLFGWLFLAGKCRKCKNQISWQYPAAELLVALVFLLVALATPADDIFLLIWRLVLVFGLTITVLSDLRYMEIPDQISLPLIGFLLVTLGVNIASPLLSNAPTFTQSLLGALLVYGFFSLQVFIPNVLLSFQKKELRFVKDAVLAVVTFPIWVVFALVGLGYWFEKLTDSSTEDVPLASWIGGGDLRIAIIIGLGLGPALGFLAVFLAYAIGAFVSVPILLLKKRRFAEHIPFGPMLVAGFVITLLFGEGILEWYLELVGF